jgi:hypothetical protein
MVIVPHPSYPPDLAPCDFALFPKLKMELKGRRLETMSDIQRESQAVIDTIKENDFHGAFEAWGKRWDRCIRSQEAILKETTAKFKYVKSVFLFWLTPGTFR